MLNETDAGIILWILPAEIDAGWRDRSGDRARIDRRRRDQAARTNRSRRELAVIRVASSNTRLSGGSTVSRTRKQGR